MVGEGGGRPGRSSVRHLLMLDSAQNCRVREWIVLFECSLSRMQATTESIPSVLTLGSRARRSMRGQPQTHLVPSLLAQICRQTTASEHPPSTTAAQNMDAPK